MPRLFVAIDLPEPLRETISHIPHSLQGAKWVARDQYHLTLRFIGEVTEDLSAAMKSALAHISAAPFTLSIKGLGCFPPRGIPRVLWLGLNPSKPLLALQEQVEQAVTSCGLLPESRPFSPHLTLARFRDPLPHAEVAGYLLKHGNFSGPPFTVTDFHLYSSRLTPAGAVHTRERTYHLTGDQLMDA